MVGDQCQAGKGEGIQQLGFCRTGFYCEGDRMLLDSFDQGSEVIIYVLKGSWDLCLLNRFGLEDQKFSVIHLQFEMPDISSGNIEQAIGYRVWNARERSEW